ncbi:MAG: HAD-IIB family hydrolase, partial [Pirellulales bacterium]
MVLAVCRPDRRKNIQALLKAYGESPELQAIANLAVFAGVREDIESMPENERQVLTEILLLMDRYDLYGRIAIPKRHDSDYDVPELYRLTAGLRGIFVNSAFIELFGLTAIEAAAVGLPFVATADGGPQDIVANCRSGITVDVTKQDELIAAMLKLLTDQELWEASSLSGINNVRTHYSWATHCRDYISLVRRLIGTETETAVDTTCDEQLDEVDSTDNRSDFSTSSKTEAEAPTPLDIAAAARNAVCRSPLVTAMSRRLQRAEVMLISDIDGTLTGDAAALESLMECVRRSNGRICFGVASGRSPALIEAAIAEFRLELPEIIIASVGSEILLGPYREIWTDWSDTIADDWRPHALAERLAELDCIEPQAGPHQQGPFKLSYILRSGMTIAEAGSCIEEQLRGADSPYRLIISHGNLVDVLPAHSGKGNALRFLLERLDFPLDLVLAAGDSENDRDILTMGLKSIVVGNHAAELDDLRNQTSSNIYFSKGRHSAGV